MAPVSTQGCTTTTQASTSTAAGGQGAAGDAASAEVDGAATLLATVLQLKGTSDP